MGAPVPLETIEQTRGLAAMVGQGATLDGFVLNIPTGIQRLTVAYQPNVRKNRDFRKAPAPLRYLGRSDYAGNEGVLSSLDMVWSSYMRDVKAARSRLFVAEDLANITGPGRAATWDDEQEVFLQLKSLSALDSKNLVDAQQFEIRFAEHEAAILSLTKTLLRSAGLGTRDYDPRGEGAQLTATGELQRNRREETTRDRQKRYATNAVGYIMSVALEMDAIVYTGRGGAAGVTVDLDFPAEQQEDQEQTARVIAMLETARAISLETKVRRANPEWDDTEVREEVERIRKENPPVADALRNAQPAPNPQADPSAEDEDADLT